MIKPKCYFCKRELKEYGAIILRSGLSVFIISPPDEKEMVDMSSSLIDPKNSRYEKLHVCKKCYKKMFSI
jgi:hypothetical protein